MLNIIIHNEYDFNHCKICNEKIENDKFNYMESNNYPIKLNCGHIVHYHCLYTLENYTCPCCNKIMDNKYLINEKLFQKKINNNSFLQKLISIFI